MASQLHYVTLRRCRANSRRRKQISWQRLCWTAKHHPHPRHHHHHRVISESEQSELVKVWKDHRQDQLTDLQHGRHYPLILNRPKVKAPPPKDETSKTLKRAMFLLVQVAVEFTQDLIWCCHVFMEHGWNMCNHPQTQPLHNIFSADDKLSMHRNNPTSLWFNDVYITHTVTTLS